MGLISIKSLSVNNKSDQCKEKRMQRYQLTHRMAENHFLSKVSKWVTKQTNSRGYTIVQRTCLKISSVTRWTPRCCGLKCIFRWSQAGWPTMRPCPRPEPEPLLWLAEQAMPRPLLRCPLPPPALPLWLQKAVGGVASWWSSTQCADAWATARAAFAAAEVTTSSASTLASTCCICLWLRPASLPRYLDLVYSKKYQIGEGTSLTRQITFNRRNTH